MEQIIKAVLNGQQVNGLKQERIFHNRLLGLFPLLPALWIAKRQ